MITKKTTLLYLVRDDQILLAQKKRGFGEGYWNGIGGKIEPEETVEQALVRECQEEIGVTPLTYRKVAAQDFVQLEQSADSWRMLVETYICTEWEGDPAESEEMKPDWFALTDIPYDSMWPSDKHWLPLVLEGNLLHTTFTLDSNNEVVDHTATVVTKLD